MSHSPQAPNPTPPRERSGAGVIVLIVIGGVLLLPGLCSLWFMFAFGGLSDAGPLLGLWLICVAISIGGIALIVHALRR